MNAPPPQPHSSQTRHRGGPGHDDAAGAHLPARRELHAQGPRGRVPPDRHLDGVAGLGLSEVVHRGDARVRGGSLRSHRGQRTRPCCRGTPRVLHVVAVHCVVDVPEEVTVGRPHLGAPNKGVRWPGADGGNLDGREVFGERAQGLRVRHRHGLRGRLFVHGHHHRRDPRQRHAPAGRDLEADAHACTADLRDSGGHPDRGAESRAQRLLPGPPGQQQLHLVASRHEAPLPGAEERGADLGVRDGAVERRLRRVGPPQDGTQTALPCLVREERLYLHGSHCDDRRRA
mmetsp:Transcript_1693/g.5547  ORF Transcript_1693/g.5547 Transcript_1693/m.5547 type:complete len:287 (+) Transcript_1693:71-931(+)